MRRAGVQSYFSTKLFPIEDQRGSGKFYVCVLDGSRQFPALNNNGLLNQLIGQQDRIVMDAPIPSVDISRIPIADSHVLLSFSYNGAVDQSEFVVPSKIKHNCLA